MLFKFLCRRIAEKSAIEMAPGLTKYSGAGLMLKIGTMNKYEYIWYDWQYLIYSISVYHNLPQDIQLIINLTIGCCFIT